METSADIFAVWNAAAACGCGCLITRGDALDCTSLYARAALWGCGCPKAFERPRCTVEYSAWSEGWSRSCRRLLTLARAALAGLYALRLFTASITFWALVPY